MERKLSTYVDLIGGSGTFYVAIVGEIFERALNDGVKKLKMTQADYEIVRRYMVHSAQWSWDGKTFMGMELVIEQP